MEDRILKLVTLPDADRMSDALIRVSPEWGHRAHLYPQLLSHAGETLSIEELSRLFAFEVSHYSRGTIDLTGLVAKWIFRMIDDDAVAAAVLASYVRFALYADDAVLQEFDDYTTSRLIGAGSAE